MMSDAALDHHPEIKSESLVVEEARDAIHRKEEQLDCARKLIHEVGRAKRLHLDIVSSEGWPLMGYLLTIRALLQVMFKDELEK